MRVSDLKAKRKDILKLLSPCTMEVITGGQVKKVFKLDSFLSTCIDKYAEQVGAVNIKYNVEYLKQNESEAKNG